MRNKMAISTQEYIKRRKDRAVASILGYSEREIYRFLSNDQKSEFRQTVLDSLGSFYDAILDFVRADDGIRNDAVFELLERIDKHLVGQSSN